MKCLIVTGGEIQDSFACEEIKVGGYELIIAADKGLDFLYRHHVTPDIVVGDLDSVNHETLYYYEDFQEIEFTKLSPEKDDTDTEFAIRDAISRGATNITILGATGGNRIDHLLGNINLLGIAIESEVSIVIKDEKNHMQMMNKSFVMKKNTQYGKYVSLIPYGGNVKGVTLEGFKYNLSDYTMGGYNTLGISNEIREEEAKVTFTEGVMLVIQSKD